MCLGTHPRVGRFRAENSAGGTPTGAAGTTALAEKSVMTGDNRKKWI
jgi:hypothetical protein